MEPIYPCIWFDNQAQEAAEFYTSVFKNSKINATSHYGENMHLPAGTVMTVEFELNGRKFLALNGGPVFKPNEAISLVVECDNQQEIDELWTKLTAKGGKEVQCGWLTDRYGVSWQITPAIMSQWLNDKDQERTNRVMQALMKMVKLDIATLKAAYEGKTAAAG
jgi:two-component system sensor histidine kinase QseC